MRKVIDILTKEPIDETREDYTFFQEQIGETGRYLEGLEIKYITQFSILLIIPISAVGELSLKLEYGESPQSVAEKLRSMADALDKL